MPVTAQRRAVSGWLSALDDERASAASALTASVVGWLGGNRLRATFGKVAAQCAAAHRGGNAQPCAGPRKRINNQLAWLGQMLDRDPHTSFAAQ